MGYAKEWYMKQEERGYFEASGAICESCATDPALKYWISQNLTDSTCSFCGSISDELLAAEFDEFVGIVIQGLRFEWNNPDDEGIMYISAEGGYTAPIYDTADVLELYEISDNQDVMDKIVALSVHSSWVKREFYIGDQSERLTWGWEVFKDFVKHTTRYVFLTSLDDNISSDISPSQLLFMIGNMVANDLAEVGLLKTISAGTDLFRVRIGESRYWTGTDIGTPPASLATQSNRMSPAGIPMFYGAFDKDTAKAETIDPNRTTEILVSIGKFRPIRDLRVLDLASLPPIPSIFEIERHHLIHPLRFLHAFADDIAKPIARDGREHIEYVPTQVVTEYFRRVFRDRADQAIDGIVYRSSRDGAGRAFVLFCENEQCSGPSEETTYIEQLLELTGVTHERA